MPDPILDEIHRVRDELVKKHGGIEGYLRYVLRLDQARRRRIKQVNIAKTRQRKAKV